MFSARDGQPPFLFPQRLQKDHSVLIRSKDRSALILFQSNLSLVASDPSHKKNNGLERNSSNEIAFPAHLPQAVFRFTLVRQVDVLSPALSPKPKSPMKTSFFIALTLFLSLNLQAEDTAPAVIFKPLPVPIEEQRQQLLLGLSESRLSYSLPEPELGFYYLSLKFSGTTYRDGKEVAKHSVAVFDFSQEVGPQTGTISIGWIEDTRGLAIALARARGWISGGRIKIPETELAPVVDTRPFTEPFPVTKEQMATSGTVKLIPVLGFCGDRQFKLGSDFKTATEYIEA